VTAESQWTRVLERTIGDVIHHLNGRIMALRGVHYAAQAQPTPDADLIALIEEEIRQAEQYAWGLQSIPRGQDQAEAPLSVMDAVRQAVAAKRLNRSTSIEVSAPSGVPLVMRAVPNQVVKALILLLRAAAENRRRTGDPITLEVVPKAGEAHIVIGTEASNQGAGAAAVEEAKFVAGGFGGTVSAAFGADAFTAVLVLPLVTNEPG